MKIKPCDALICPVCECDYLHQIEANCTWRHGEDGAGDCYSSSKNRHSIERLDAKKIPNRRDNLVIKFHCEGCDNKQSLIIFQHKGQTFMDWLK